MASFLTQYVNTVISITPTRNYKELYDFINKSSDSLSKNIQHLDNVLQTLNVQTHSLGVMAVLVTKLRNTNNAAMDTIFVQIQEFIMDFDPSQIWVAPDLYTEFCHCFTNYLVEQKQAIKGINILKQAIKRPGFLAKAQLTSIHADLCKLCLIAKCLKPALEILDVDIHSIYEEIASTSSTAPLFDAKYFLLYYYYGGLIYLAFKNLDRALYFFEVALTTPAHTVSHIMLEANKKYILVSLLIHGKVQSIAKYSSKVISRFIKPLSQAYFNLAEAFILNDTAEFNSTVTRHSEVFNRDQNMGLVKQVAQSLYRKNIQRLTKTFLTLSLSDVASRVGLPSPLDAEKHILSMIENGQIYAVINQKDGMVIFKDEPNKYDGLSVVKMIENELSQTMDINNRITAMSEEMQTNPTFVKKVAGLQDDESAGMLI